MRTFDKWTRREFLIGSSCAFIVFRFRSIIKSRRNRKTGGVVFYGPGAHFDGAWRFTKGDKKNDSVFQPASGT